MAGDATVNGDAIRLRQVLWNVLNNAMKFTPTGGHIFVTTGEDSGRVMVEVRDTGLGIAPEALAVVFDAFEQTSSAFARSLGGLGLGLSIVRSLVGAHDGTVEIRSEGIGKGTAVRIKLPVVVGALNGVGEL
jgi:signal transduction histidine kinase